MRGTTRRNLAAADNALLRKGGRHGCSKKARRIRDRKAVLDEAMEALIELEEERRSRDYTENT